jgi:hypothetical protein
VARQPEEVARESSGRRRRWLAARTWGASPEERRRAFPCDSFLPGADDAAYRAVDVEAPAAVLFRWLAQLRVAPYSYDWIDNLGRRSPRRLVPGLDALAVGQRVMTIFELVAFERERHLTLRSRPSRLLGTYALTYLVVPVDARRCRLVVKILMAYPRPLRAVLRRVMPLADLIMMRKQLLTLKRLAEEQARAAGRGR